MTVPDLTLNKVKETAKVKYYRASDLLTQEELDDLHLKNYLGSKKKVEFDSIDAYIAEVIAVFGYDTYLAWKRGEISQTNMDRYISAERSRRVNDRIGLEALIVNAVAGANHPSKNKQAPKSLKNAYKILQAESKKIKGGK